MFQRGMSRSEGKRIDHSGHGDRHKREEAVTLDQLREFLTATQEAEFQGCGRDDERYRHIEAVLWRMDETYVKVRGQWTYLYRTVDKEGKTIDFLRRANRDKAAATSFFEKAMRQNGDPEKVTMDK